MTNAEKYLKDGVDGLELWNKIIDYVSQGAKYSVEDFFKEEAKPTLTEDEKVILKNIGPRYIRIARTSINKDLYVTNNDKTIQHFLFAFSHLFQFIKPGEEYKISDLLEE